MATHVLDYARCAPRAAVVGSTFCPLVYTSHTRLMICKYPVIIPFLHCPHIRRNPMNPKHNERRPNLRLPAIPRPARARRAGAAAAAVGGEEGRGVAGVGRCDAAGETCHHNSAIVRRVSRCST